MHGTTSTEVMKRLRTETWREAEHNRLNGAPRADRERPTVPRCASTVAQELATAAGLLRRPFGMSKG